MVFLVTEYYFFHAMRKDLAPQAVQEAFDIHVVAFCANSGDQPKTSEFKIVDFPWRRSKSLARAALQFLPELLRVRRLLRSLAPEILHNIALKPTIIGSLAMWDCDTRIVNTLTGLGFVFFARSPLARLAQGLFGRVLRHAVVKNDVHVVLHNTRDVDFVRTRFGLPQPNVRLIRGLGIDTGYFTLMPPPASEAPFRFLVIARFLYMKGIHIAIAAHQILRDRGLAVELLVCGGPDVDNPSTVPEGTITVWKTLPGVRLLGQVPDVRAAIAESHVVVHPALGGEGLPRVLLEGAACGRPLIATDVSGSTDIVIARENGLLVKPGDAVALATAMEWMINHPAERERLGRNGRARVLQEFASEHVAASYTELYSELRPGVASSSSLQIEP